MKENIGDFSKRSVTEIRNINRDLIEKALAMRCQGYLAQAKVKLLSQTINEIDQSKKAVVSSHMKLLKNNDCIASQKEELERKTQALERSNEDLKNFSRVASHDLRSPLQTVLTNADILTYKYAPLLDKEGLQFLESIKHSVFHMRDMIDVLLNQSNAKGQEHSINMNDLVKEQIDHFLAVIEQDSVSVTQKELPVVIGDKDQLNHLIQSLLENALKYRAKGRRLEIGISANHDGKEWVFSIQDNGIGIDSAEFDRLFELFQRADPNESIEGLGIALASCTRIIAHHGGRIWVESEVGRGSNFLFTLSPSE